MTRCGESLFKAEEIYFKEKPQSSVDTLSLFLFFLGQTRGSLVRSHMGAGRAIEVTTIF